MDGDRFELILNCDVDGDRFELILNCDVVWLDMKFV